MTRLFFLFIMLLAASAQAADPQPLAPSSPAPMTPIPAIPAPVTTVPDSPTAPASPVPATASPAPPLPIKDPEVVLNTDLAQRLTVGKAVELPVGDRQVLGLYTEQTAPKAKGALLLLHDLGGHADWPGVIGELRRALPVHGWTTLSVQLPVPGNTPPAAQQTTFLEQSAARIDAALAYLKAAHPGEIVLAGHGFGALAALNYSATHAEEFVGLVLVGLPHRPNADPRFDAAATLARLHGPVLDLYGSADHWDVVVGAGARRAAARANTDYSEVVLPSADHFLRGQEQVFTRRVRGWLEHHAMGKRLALSRAANPDQSQAQPKEQPPQPLTPQVTP